MLSWKGPIGIIKSNSWPCVGHTKNEFHMPESVVPMKYSKNKASLITNSWDLQRGEYVRMAYCRENILWLKIILHTLITLLVYYF